MTLALLKSIFLLLLLILVTFSAPFPNDLCVETLHTSWTFTRVSCLWVNGSVAVWPWNDSVWVFLQQIWIFLLVHARMTGFAICALRVEVRCSTKAKGQTFSLHWTFHSALFGYILYRYSTRYKSFVFILFSLRFVFM